MSSSKRPSHCLSVEASEPGLSVLVMDAAANIVGRVADDEERLELDLPQGLYTIRSSRSGAFAEQVIRLDHSQPYKAEPPPVFSAAPVPGAKTTHEYYSNPAWEASQKLTGEEQAWDGDADAQLLLFVRAVDKDAYDGKDQLASLSLRTLDGRSLSEFRNDARRDRDFGWSAYSAQLSHGLLIVEDLGELPRQIPVPLFKDWQTQIYVIHHQRLLWDDMRLILVHKNELNSRNDRRPNDHNAEDELAMDAGLLALQNDTPSVAPQLIDTFISSKFSNPILGLLGAYLMLIQHQRKKAVEGANYNPNIAQIRTVLNNLNDLLPRSGDVAALRFLAKDWVKSPKLDPVTYVPLFRSGTKILLREASSDPELLPEGSLLDEVSTSLYGDTVWTTWKPVALGRINAKYPEVAAGNARNASWVEQAVIDTITAAEFREVDLAPEDLVRQIGVSAYAVRRAFESLMERAPSQQLPSQVQRWILRQISGEVTNTLASTLGEQFEKDLSRLISDNLFEGEQVLKPSWQKTYPLLKKILSQFADPCVGKISADTMLAEIIRPDDELGWFFASRMISRKFRDYNISLSDKELISAQTVRDVADIMVRKSSE